ncbi:hypothetical protein [Metabacillus fastidiosus]|uniref:hypothetical protein n=1 Tax=Metabacillus fastidiosus TaxID=1458 RepID=UPI003D2AAFF2
MKINGLQNFIISSSNVNQKMPAIQNQKETIFQPVVSSNAFIKYEFRNRLQSTINDSKYDASFLINFANAYKNIKEEITNSTDPKEQEAMLAMLDEVYDETVQEKAKQLASTFEYFFDGSSKMEASYRFGSKEEVFDQKAFINHLVEIANEAKKHIGSVSSNDQLENKLAALFQGDSLEKMGYRDIKNLSAALQEISTPSLWAKTSNLGKKLAEWNERAENILQSSDLSETVKEKAKKTVADSTETYKKVGTYIQTFNTYRQSIEEKFEEFKKTQLEIERIEKQLEEIHKKMKNGKIDYMSFLTTLLERQQSLQVTSKGIVDSLNGLKEKNEKLVNNPSIILDSDEYKEVQKNYENSKKKNEAFNN